MFLRLIRSSCLALAIGSLVAASARANTYVVGPGPGADFPDIPSAIAGSQPGDVLLVQAHAYSGGFTLDKGLTIIGYGAVDLAGEGRVLSIPAAQRAAIVNISLLGMQLDKCEGLVILQYITSAGIVRISTCTDVRCFSITADPPPFPTVPAVDVSDSRVEFVEASLTGSDLGSSCCGDSPGATGLVGNSGSRIHLALFDIKGGGGQDNYGPNVYTGSGAPAIVTSSTAELLLTGSGLSRVMPGGANPNWWYQTCCFDGQESWAVDMSGGSLWHSGVTWSPSYLHDSVQDCCDLYQLPVRVGPGTFEELTPGDPSLTLEGAAVSGSQLTFVLRGPVGAAARLAVGRRTTLVPAAASSVEQLVVSSGRVTMGIIPPSGELRFTMQIPDTFAGGHLLRWSPGTFFVAQAEITLSGSQRIRRSNSVPIVVR